MFENPRRGRQARKFTTKSSQRNLAAGQGSQRTREFLRAFPVSLQTSEMQIPNMRM